MFTWCTSLDVSIDCRAYILKRQMKWWGKHLASLVLWKRSRRAKLIALFKSVPRTGDYSRDVCNLCWCLRSLRPSCGLDSIDQWGYIIHKPINNIFLVEIGSKSVLGIPSAGLTGCSGKDNCCCLYFLHHSWRGLCWNGWNGTGTWSNSDSDWNCRCNFVDSLETRRNG